MRCTSPPTAPRRRRAGRLALAGAALLAVAACGPAEEADGDGALAEREAEIERLQDQVAELEAEVERLRAEEPPPAEGGEQPASPRTPEGLVEQLHALFPPDPELGFEPGTTPWEETPVPDGFGEGQAAYDSAGALLTALAEDLAAQQLGGDVWEVTTRVLFDPPEAGLDAEAATGAILQWGFLDDAVAGSDHRVALRRGDDGWFVASAEQRSRCARGVSDDGLCV